jgi:hypothetical protein
MHDYAQCGGPNRCLHCRTILFETPEEACAHMTEENCERGLRAAGEAYVFRAGVRMCTEEESMKSLHNSYESDDADNRVADSDEDRALAAQADVEKKLAAMAEFRQQVLDTAATARFAAARPATSRVHLEPDPYTIAIERMKEQR